MSSPGKSINSSAKKRKSVEPTQDDRFSSFLSQPDTNDDDQDLSEEFKGEKAWDSNAITPGTPFMDKLAKSLRYWVRKKLNEDPGWAGVSLNPPSYFPLSLFD